MNKFLKLFLIVGIVIILIFISQHSTWTSDVQVDIQYVKIAGVKFKVNLALTSIEEKRGLSGKRGLKKNEVMYFVFNNTSKHSFWMKDMNFNIDIITPRINF